MWIFWTILAIFVIILIVRNVRIVAQTQIYIIERLGKYHTTWREGPHLKIPFIDSIVKKINMKEQVLDFPPQAVITKDNVSMQIDAVVYAQVMDAKLYTYGIENPLVALENLTATTLRSVIGDMDLDQTLSSRKDINDKMTQQLDEATDAWGIRVNRVEIKNVQPPADIREVMAKQMTAERNRRETLLEAQAHEEAAETSARGDKKAMVLQAEARKESDILIAQGKAEAARLEYETQAAGIEMLKRAGIDANTLQWRAIDAMKDVADGQATKIYLPTDMASSLCAFGMIGEGMTDGKKDVKPGVPRDQMRHDKAVKEAERRLADEPCMNRGAGMQSALRSSAAAGAVATSISEGRTVNRRLRDQDGHQ